MVFPVIYSKQLLTTDGSVSGLIQVPDTSNLVEGALVYIASDTKTPRTALIAKILNGTDLYLRPVNVTGDYTYLDASPYLFADNATLTQPAQEFAGFNEEYGEVRILQNNTPRGIANALNFSGAVAVTVSGDKANIFVTNSGPGSSYPVVGTYNDLPITVGSPPVDTIYVVKTSSGIWLINRKERGLYIRTADTGSLSDWKRLGDWLEAFSDNNFAIYDNLDNSKQVRFDVGGLTTGITRLLTIPDKSGTVALTDDVVVGVKKNGGAIVGSRPAINLIEGTNVSIVVADDVVNNEVDVTINAAGGGGPGGGGVAISAGTVSQSTGTVIFSNSNGVSFGLNAGTLTASHNGLTSQSNQTIGAYAAGNTTGQSSSSTFDARTLSVSGAGIISVGYSAGNLIVSASAAGAADGVNIIAAGTQTANTTGTVVFSNSNNVSFGLSNNSVVTASASYSQSTAPSAIAAGTQTATSGTVVFSNSNGLSFGLNNGTVTASYTVPSVPAQTQQPMYFSASGSSTSANTLQFGNSNGVSFSLSNGSLVGTVKTDYLTTQTVQTQNMVSVLGSTGNISFANSNGITFGGNASTITASHNGLTSQSNQAVSAGNGSVAFQTLSFADSNGVSFSTGTQGLYATVKTDYLTTQTVQTQNMVSVQGSTGNISFSNSNGITFGFNASTITASHNGLTTQTVQTLGGYAVGNTTGQSSSSTFDARTLSLSGAGIVSVGYSAGNIIVSASAAGAADGVNIIAAGTQTANTTGTVVFSNSNNVSFGMSNNSVVTASASYSQSTAPGAIAAGTQTATSGTVVFSNSNGISFGLSNSSVVTASAVRSELAAGNNISLSTAGSTISIHGNNPLAVSAGTVSQSSGTVIFSNSNGVSFGLNAGTLTVSHNGLTSQSNQAVSAGNGSFTFQTVSFADSNGVSFSTGTQGLYATVKTDYLTTQTVQTLGGYAVGNTTGQSSSSTFDARTLSFSGAGNISVGYSAGNIIISATGGGAGDGYNILAAGTQTANTTGTIVFVNSNNVTFGMSNSSEITASIPAGATATGNFGAIGAGTQTATSGTVNFVNSNGITFGMSGSNQITASHNGLTTSAAIATQVYDVGSAGSTGTVTRYAPEDHVHAGVVRVYAGSNTGNTLGDTVGRHGNWVIAASGNATISGSTGGAGIHTAWVSVAPQTIQTQNMVSVQGSTGNISFSNSNGITFGFNASTITASHNGLTSQSNQAVSAANGSFTFQTLTFANSNGVSFSTGTQGLYATVKTDYLTTQSNAALSGSNGSFTFQTATFGNLNGLSFYTSNGSMVGSHNALTSQSNQALSAANGSFTFQTATFANSNGISFSTGTQGLYASHNGITSQSNQVLSVYAASNTTQSSSGTINASNLSFNGAGIASVGVSNGSVVISVPLGGGAGDGYNILAAGTQTAGQSATVVFSNSNGVSFGMSNNSVITASVGELTVPYYCPADALPLVAGVQGQGTLHIQPAILPNVTFDRIAQAVYFSNTNNTGTVSITQAFGFYTINGATLSLFTSTSQQFTLAFAGGNSTTNANGIRLLTIPFSSLLTGGQYYIGVVNSTTTAGGAATFSQMHASQLNSNFSGILGAGSNATAQLTRGLGVYTAATAAIPNSIAFSQINGTASLALRRPVFYLVNQTF